MLRIAVPALAALAIALGLVLWLGREEMPLMPPPAPAAVAAADDRDLERLVVEVLVHRLGGRADGWRSLPDPARCVWAVRACESRLAMAGAQAVAVHHREDPTYPSLEEIAAAYRAMGLEAAAQAVPRLEQADAAPLQRAVRDPAALRARTAFLRKHLDELGGR